MLEMRPLVYHHDCGMEWRIKAGGRTEIFDGQSFGSLILKKWFMRWTLTGLGKNRNKKDIKTEKELRTEISWPMDSNRNWKNR
jgi:hypothetical protein